jgi:hypothetical protein
MAIAARRGPAAFAAVLLAAPAVADAPGFAPGAWTHETRMVSADVPGVPDFLVRIFAGDRTRQSCLTAQQAMSAPQALLTQDDAAQCHLRRFVMSGGRFEYVTFCTNRRFPQGLTIASTGTYAPGSYAMHSVATGAKGGRPVRIVTDGTGRRTGECR